MASGSWKENEESSAQLTLDVSYQVMKSHKSYYTSLQLAYANM